MRYLEMSCISKTNKLFQKLQDINPQLNIEVEAYSCKSSRKQRGQRDVEKPLQYLQSALGLRFPDYDFHGESWRSFERKTLEEVLREVAYSISTTHKNSEDVKEFVGFLEMILDRSIDTGSCLIFSYKNRMGPFEDCFWYFSFLLFSKRQKRVVMLNAFMSRSDV
ncbi:Maf1 regulator protein [Encephalitozoon intestinalis]|nr:Maf1 regulator protein [Encephalitozoon intestinalis]